MEYKKNFAIAILTLLFGLAAYSLAETAQNTATTANQTVNNISQNVTQSFGNYSVNVSGQPAIENFTTLVEDGNITLTQDTINHVIKIKANNTAWDLWGVDKPDYFNKTEINTSQAALDQRVLNIELNLSNITMITANGSIVASNLPDGYGNITNVTISGGLIATYI